MDFDPIEYLEKTVENSEAKKDIVNGDDAVKSDRKSSRHRSDENNDDDLDSRSKRARSGDETRDHDRRREKSSSRHRSSPDHRSRDGDRSERDRHRSSREHRDRHRNGRERESSRDRDREKDRKERDRESEREKERERSRRSRSASERRRTEKEAERERDREKSRERERDREKSREREREREKERERESRRYKEKKEEEPEADPERDQRTVFAYQISLKADERHVYEFFSRAGKVRDVRLIMDRNSRRSKGVGYIEFYDAMSVPMAIALSGQPLLGYPVMVKPSEAEKNLVQSNVVVGPGGSVGPYSGGARRLYVGNLHFNMTEEQLRQVFEPFGAVELVQLPLDPETGMCKGFGFVQFARLEDARNAQSLNGQLEIAGRIIK
ncbi:hypothetical protein MKW94_009625, partial [Papaver nudicaule]|nr:hypothetical protein [Papaver nudicaule]